jgi:hypothetical protein
MAIERFVATAYHTCMVVSPFLGAGVAVSCTSGDSVVDLVSASVFGGLCGAVVGVASPLIVAGTPVYLYKKLTRDKDK